MDVLLPPGIVTVWTRGAPRPHHTRCETCGDWASPARRAEADAIADGAAHYLDRHAPIGARA